jgi:hypothetical protein
MDEIRENDLVALVNPRPDSGFKRGDVGTVIQLFDRTPDHPSGFIVEVVDETGGVLGETDVTDPAEIVKLRWDPKGTLEEWAGNISFVAIVFTDIIDSSALGRELGDRDWFDLLQTHFTNARKITNTFGGHEIHVIGDSYLVAFRTVVAAFDFAMAFQQNTGDERIKIRAGLHFGAARIIDDDILGINDDLLGLMIHHRPQLHSRYVFNSWIVLSDEAKNYLDDARVTKYWWLNLMKEEVSFPGSSDSWRFWYVLSENKSLEDSKSQE